MSHLDEGTLQALADGELREAAEHDARTHLAGCEVCREGYRELETAAASLSAALHLLDRPVTAPATLRPPPSMAPGRRRWGGVALPKVAALLLVAAAAVSATIPGSPVRDWLGGRAEAPAPAIAVRQEAEPRTAPAVLAAPAESGVSVAPANGTVRILLVGAAPELTVRAALSDAPRAGVYASGAAATARFQTSAGTIQVMDAGPGDIRIEIPRAAQQASVVVNGRTYLIKEGDRLHLTAQPDDGEGAEVRFQVGP